MAAAIPDAIRPRLGQFVRLLASDQPGEVVAAAAALRRALAGIGADLNDLGDAIERPAVVMVDAPQPAQPRRGRKPRAPAPGSIELDPLQRRQVVDALSRANARGALSSWEAEFVASVVVTLRSARPRLSVRQIEIVERFMAKFGEGTAWASV